MKLFALRYFVIKTSYLLFEDENVKTPSEYFTKPILNKEEVLYYNKKYTTRLLNDEGEKRYYLGFLLKSADTNLIQLEDELFDEEEIPNWEKLFFVIDTEEQIFLCEHNLPVATPENIKNVLQKLTEKRALENGCEVKLEFIVDEFQFWDIIKSADGIYQIAFELNAPNLFGGRKKANEWLTVLKEKHNMTKVSVDFRNENADLKYEEEELESYRDYSDSGGGNWTLGILKGKRKKQYKSVNHLKTKEIDVDTANPKKLKNQIKSILEKTILLINEVVTNENKKGDS